MTRQLDVADSRLAMGSNPENDVGGDSQRSFSTFLLVVFQEATHGRERIPLQELQRELSKRGWHTWK
jgi:hypothetical protein